MTRSIFFGLLLASIAGSTAGCASDAPPLVLGGDTDPNGGQICLRVNCQDNTDCRDCEEGKTVCNVKEKRCVACGPLAGGKTCPSGQTCSDYGDCVGSGSSCAADPNGVPTGSCSSDTDCAACSPKYRVCDTTKKKCVSCTDGNRKMCQTTDICVQNTCTPACPPLCALDSDCAKCGAPGAEARQCFRGECAQCNEDADCSSGQMCDDHGKCVPSCGNRQGRAPDLPGSCSKDSDCAACNGTTKCKVPLVGTGVCASPLPGCSDLGNGSITLPLPFSRVTNTCSTDTDCANVSADINVGELLRKVTGIGAIKDGTLSYKMSKCAPVEVASQKCGICVPCESDSDCVPIDIASVTGGIFGPLGSIAARILLDKVFGPGEKQINMYCTKLFDKYGACVPCSNVLSACGTGRDMGTPATSCSHGVCDAGAALARTCDAGCAGKVCDEDAYCCNNAWDRTCVQRVERLCAPTKSCAPADTCSFKEAGWYCSELQAYASYKCDANGTKIENTSCTTSQFCHREMAGAVKSPAVLDTATMKPRCFTSAQ